MGEQVRCIFIDIDWPLKEGQMVAMVAEVDTSFWGGILKNGLYYTCVIKDTLKEKAGIPTLTVDVDILDNTEAVGKHLKKQLEQFFLVLDTAKAKAA